MEKKVYYKIEYDGGSYNGASRRYDSLSKAVRYARSYVTKMSRNPYCSSDNVDVRIARYENYREVYHFYVSELSGVRFSLSEISVVPSDSAYLNLRYGTQNF